MPGPETKLLFAVGDYFMGSTLDSITAPSNGSFVFASMTLPSRVELIIGSIGACALTRAGSNRKIEIYGINRLVMIK